MLSLYAARREFGLNVAGEETAGLVILLQHGVKVRDRESSHKQMRLFACADQRSTCAIAISCAINSLSLRVRLGRVRQWLVGADSVASALHLRSGATPRGPGQTIMTLRARRQKAELLILHKTGTSHFALTIRLTN